MFWFFLATVSTCLAVWSTGTGKIPVGGERKWLTAADARGKFAVRLAALWALSVGLWAYAAWVLT